MQSIYRLIKLHDIFIKGGFIEKQVIMKKFEIDSKTFQKDIEKLRTYYFENYLGEIIYNRKENNYKLEDQSVQLTKEDIYAICKILIESRIFNKDEFTILIDKLLNLICKTDSKKVVEAINNKKINYIELQYGRKLIYEIWQLRQAITSQNILSIVYSKSDEKKRKYKIKPVGILFSEFYFYLLAFPLDKNLKFPTIFRIDRIHTIETTKMHFSIPYQDNFSEADFKNKTIFMYSGELQTIRFQ